MSKEDSSPAKQGAAAGQEQNKKPKLVQIGDAVVSMRDVLRMYPASGFDSHGDPVYHIVIVVFKGFEIEHMVTWSGDEGETHRDQEWVELLVRMEEVGYNIM